MSFLAFESKMRHWSEPGPSPTAAVAFADTGTAWVAAGAPLADATRISHVASAFVRSAREKGRRACFFGTESPAMEGFSRVLLGQQPVWEPATWPESLAGHRRLREQIRRAGNKGVVVRRADPREFTPGSPLRRKVELLAEEWLGSRPMIPMGFMVAIEPFHLPEEHRYFVAQRGDETVAFLSAVPVYGRGGWLVEDLLRSPRAPNGTSEALIDAMMRDAGGSAFVTLGLAPLSGPIPAWLRLAGFVSSPFFDFSGVRAFRHRLRPARWESVWLHYPRSEWALPHVIDSLRAFAGGSLVRFALLSFVRKARRARS